MTLPYLRLLIGEWCMLRRVSSPLCTIGVSASPSQSARRHETTGEHHTFRPGPITKTLRFVFRLVTPRALVKRIACRMQLGMEKVEELEKEHRWLKLNGSPLAVLGLPEHADLQEVRSRYRDLVLDLHPDTAIQAAASASADSAGRGNKNELDVQRSDELEISRRAEEYERMQTAYRMLTSPDSLFFQSGSAPHLHDALSLALARNGRKKLLPRATRISLFALFFYTLMLLALIIFSFYWMEGFLLEFVAQVDPEFYKFFTAAETEEKRREALGEVLDKNPKRLAPTKVRKMLMPGAFIGKEKTLGEDVVEG